MWAEHPSNGRDREVMAGGSPHCHCWSLERLSLSPPQKKEKKKNVKRTTSHKLKISFFFLLLQFNFLGALGGICARLSDAVSFRENKQTHLIEDFASEP